MKQDILNALCQDEKKYSMIMQKTKQRNITRLRWKVFAELLSKGHKQYKIAMFFNTRPSVVYYGVNRNKEINDFEERRKRIVKF